MLRAPPLRLPPLMRAAKKWAGMSEMREGGWVLWVVLCPSVRSHPTDTTTAATGLSSLSLCTSVAAHGLSPSAAG